MFSEKIIQKPLDKTSMAGTLCQLSTVNGVNFAPIYLNGNYARNFSFAKDSGFFIFNNFLEDEA